MHVIIILLDLMNALCEHIVVFLSILAGGDSQLIDKYILIVSTGSQYAIPGIEGQIVDFVQMVLDDL
mgnify:CR=1 FL=1